VTTPQGAPGNHDQDDVEAHRQSYRHGSAYDTLHASDEFAELRRRYRSFVFPATIAFLAWYLLYVVLSNWAHDFMSIKLVGNINVALAFGVLQFVTTFVLAWLYSRYSTAKLDPLARSLDEQFQRGQGGAR
jgi:uncharacterized membrane protein (DUF485 family)